MSLSNLHVLTSSSDANSKISYEYFRNEELKTSENNQLKINGQPLAKKVSLRLHLDGVLTTSLTSAELLKINTDFHQVL